MVKKWLHFFSAHPIISMLIVFGLLAAAYAMVSVLSFVIPMSFGVWIATIITFPVLSAIVFALIAVVGIFFKILNNSKGK